MTGPDEMVHSVSFWQHLLSQLRVKAPRALCGFLLIAEDGTPEPGPDGPRCPECAALDPRMLRVPASPCPYEICHHNHPEWSS